VAVAVPEFSKNSHRQADPLGSVAAVAGPEAFVWLILESEPRARPYADATSYRAKYLEPVPG